MLTASHKLVQSFTGIYPPESFKRESKYGLTILTTTHEGLLKYLKQVMDQMEAWLIDGDVQRLVVVVSGLDTGETLERWQFNIKVDGKENQRDATKSIDVDEKRVAKSIKEIHDEIQAIIRQITASVSVPCLVSMSSISNYFDESDNQFFIFCRLHFFHS